MDVEIVKQTLLWCAVINYGFLLVWFVFFALGSSWIYRMHSMWFAIERERFDAIHYSGMAFLKIAAFVFTLCPYIALRIVTG